MILFLHNSPKPCNHGCLIYAEGRINNSYEATIKKKYHNASGLYHKTSKKRNPKINLLKNKGPAKNRAFKKLKSYNKLEFVCYTNAEIISLKINFNVVIDK